MGDFNANCEKGTWIYSGHSFIAELKLHKTTPGGPFGDQRIDTVVRTRKPDGSLSVTGSKHLKATQSYTRDFGEAVQNVVDHNFETIKVFTYELFNSNRK